MIWRSKDDIPLIVSPFELGYYWVNHDAMWFIAQYSPQEQLFFMTGQYVGFRPEEFEEIELERIQQPEHLVNWNYKNRT